MDFEFDPTKSRANLAKHGIDFETAQRLWDDPNLLEAPARVSGEPRWIAIGTLDGVVWAAIFTKRGHAVRIISVRRARRSERVIYEDARL